MSVALTLDQPARLAGFIEMERPDVAGALRRSGRRARNRVVQAYLNGLVRRTEAARGDAAAFAACIAKWRALRERAESAAMTHVEAIKIAAPYHGVPAPPVPSDWFGPVRDGERRGFIFYVHGGSFVFERSPALTELVMRLAAAAGARVFAPNYRLAPEHPCPAAVEDIIGAYRWFREHWPDEPMVALADSAGGAILLAALQALNRAGDPLPDGVVLLSPWVDLTLQSWSIISATLAGATTSSMAALALFAHFYLDDRSAGDPVASPLFGDFRGFPPMLVHASRGDMLFDDSARLVDKVRAAGGDLTARLWTGDAHVFEKAASAKARQSIGLAADFITSRLR